MKYLVVLALTLFNTFTFSLPSGWGDSSGISANSLWDRSRKGAQRQRDGQSSLPYHDQHGYESWNSANLGDLNPSQALDPDVDTRYTTPREQRTPVQALSRDEKRKAVASLLRNSYDLNEVKISGHMDRIWDEDEAWNNNSPETIAADIHVAYEANRKHWGKIKG